MKKTITTALILAASITTAYAYKDVWLGVDLQKIDWDKLCKNVEPVEYKGCPIVHPTSIIFSGNPSLPHNFDAENYPPNCDKEKSKFEKLKTPKSGKNKWYKCKLKFKSAYKSRVTNPEWFKEDTLTWRDRYFKDGVK